LNWSSAFWVSVAAGLSVVLAYGCTQRALTNQSAGRDAEAIIAPQQDTGVAVIKPMIQEMEARVVSRIDATAVRIEKTTTAGGDVKTNSTGLVLGLVATFVTLLAWIAYWHVRSERRQQKKGEA